jgi:hypothetical protein
MNAFLNQIKIILSHIRHETLVSYPLSHDLENCFDKINSNKVIDI